MATPATKDALKEHCLRALGKPVIDVNVDPDQCDDRLDDALQYFAEYHMDGVERMYLKYQMTSAQIARGSTNATTSVTDTVDNTGGAYAWLEQKGWLPLPAPVISVLRIFPITDQASSAMFDMKYQMRLNDLWDFTSASMINYQMLHEHLDFIDHLMTGEVPIRFNQHQNRLYLDMDWSNEIPADQYFVIECYRKLDPTTYTDVYNDIFLKKYATALIKKQWGANLIKFNGVSMLGGVQMNGEVIYTQADEEIKLLEEQLLNGYGLPADMMIG
jgi:hypothetical protein